MTELAFRAFVDGNNITAVAFPSDGGSAVLEKRIPLSGIGVDAAQSTPSQYDMPFNTFSVSGHSDLVRGGLELTLNYRTERVTLTPFSGQGSKIESYAVTYTFDGIGLEYNPETDIQKAKTRDSFRVKADPLPVSDKTWP